MFDGLEGAKSFTLCWKTSRQFRSLGCYTAASNRLITETYIIDSVGLSHFHDGTRDTDGASEQPHLRFLTGKDTLDTRLDDGSTHIRTFDMTGRGLAIDL
jgi:hypothetical protein